MLGLLAWKLFSLMLHQHQSIHLSVVLCPFAHAVLQSSLVRLGAITFIRNHATSHNQPRILRYMREGGRKGRALSILEAAVRSSLARCRHDHVRLMQGVQNCGKYLF